MRSRQPYYTHALLGVTTGAILASCGSPPPVEKLVADRFVACMADAGIEVRDVNVVVGRDRHIERFEWTANEAVPEQTGQRCEEEALERFNVSRT